MKLMFSTEANKEKQHSSFHRFFLLSVDLFGQVVLEETIF
jgi:hypothetical protein